MDRREFIVKTGTVVALASVPAALAAELKITSDAVVQVPLDKLYFVSYELTDGMTMPHKIGDVIVQARQQVGELGEDRFTVIREAEVNDINTGNRIAEYTLVPEELLNG